MYTGTEQQKAYAREWYHDNRKKILERIKKRRRKNLVKFREKGRLQAEKFRRDHPERARELQRNSYAKPEIQARRKLELKILGRKLKLEVLLRYGQQCNCCGITNPEFLHIDHVLGGGTQHREKIGRGRSFYKWLKRNNWPEGYRTLCANCNEAHGHYGYCPHETKRDFLEVSNE